MKIPLPYAEEIIGERGENIEFVRSVSGAVVILEEIGDYSEEVLIVIKAVLRKFKLHINVYRLPPFDITLLHSGLVLGCLVNLGCYMDIVALLDSKNYAYIVSCWVKLSS